MTTIQELVSKIRRRGFNRPKSKRRVENPQEYISAWLENDVLTPSGPVVNALVVILRTHGCSWASGDAGGCSMCGYINDCLSTNIALKPEDIVTQFQAAVKKFPNKQIQFVKIFTSGSFLDENEVPFSSQEHILEICNDLSVKSVLIESRPEFVIRQRLAELTNIFKGKLQLAIGLESANDKILKHVINKGFEFDDYCKAAGIARELDVQLKTYLILKPPFLTERDAISDVLNSIEQLSKHGLSDVISINPINIQKFTLVEHLFSRHDYRPPWLWSVVEVLIRGAEILSDGRIRLLSQPTAGGLRTGAHNCGACDKVVLKAINEFSLSGDVAVFQAPELDCECREKWRDILELENITKSNLINLPE